MFGGRHMRGLAQEAAKPIEVGRTLRRLLTYFRPFRVLLLALAEQRFGQLRQLHRGQFDRWFFGMGCLLTAGDGRDEQRALRWQAARKVQKLKLASLVHGGG